MVLSYFNKTVLHVKVGTKFRRQAVVTQSVYFACGLKSTDCCM
jgi:hypothetical protein